MKASGKRPWAASQLPDIMGRGATGGVGIPSGTCEYGDPAAVRLFQTFISESALPGLAKQMTRFAIGMSVQSHTGRQ
jgi:hypothetical protein